MSCDCREQVNKRLEHRNMRLVPILSLDGSPVRTMLATEKIDPKKRGKIPVLYASHCPFCGQPYSEDGKP